MTQKDLDLLQQGFDDLREECSTPEIATRFLQRAGILSADGKLAPQYGGDGNGEVVQSPSISVQAMETVRKQYFDTLVRLAEHFKLPTDQIKVEIDSNRVRGQYHLQTCKIPFEITVSWDLMEAMERNGLWQI